MQSRDYDVIVVGMGVAGHCAALEATEAGASVLMIHAEESVGGSSRFSSGVTMGANTRYQRAQGVVDDSAESFYNFYMIANHWQIQPSVARRLCFEAGPTVDWLEERGVSYLRLMGAGGEEHPRGHVTAGGYSIVLALHGQIQGHGRADLALNTRVERLLTEDGKVIGVHAGGQDVTAGAVALTCGGIGADLDLVARWQPHVFEDSGRTPRYLGSPLARGDAIHLTAGLGAQVIKGRCLNVPMWSFGAGYLPDYMVMVNALGRRFMDESSSYSVTEAIFESQPGAIAHALFDDATKRAMKSTDDVLHETKGVVPDNEPAYPYFTDTGVDEMVATGQIIKADTLDQLAQRIGVPDEHLRGTIARYNRHVANGRDDDYLKSATVLRPVSTGPFYALAIQPTGFAVTSTGVRIDHDASVIGSDSLPIPGLFAAGECTGGVMVKVYVGSGNALANCSTYGRVAGRSAVAFASTGAVPFIDWAAIEARARIAE